MTEAEWLASTDPAAMLDFLRGSNPLRAECPAPPPSDRKLRLFACAACRLVWPRLTDERSRRAVGVAERYADGGATAREVTEAGLDTLTGACLPYATEAAAYAGRRCREILGSSPAAQAALLRDLVGNPWRPWTRYDWSGTVRRPNHFNVRWLTPTVLALARAAYETGRPCEQCRGSGFKHPSWREGTCPVCHGQGSDGLLDPVRLAILADALEEAGCPTDEQCPACPGLGYGVQPEWTQEIPLYWCGQCDQRTRCISNPLLAHLRSEGLAGPHARGCWALDLILGKE